MKRWFRLPVIILLAPIGVIIYWLMMGIVAYFIWAWEWTEDKYWNNQ